MEYEKLAERVTKLEERGKSNTKQLDEMGKKVDVLNRLATSIEVMANEQKHQRETMDSIKKDVSEMGEKIEAIEQKPGKRWESIVDKIVAGLAGALATAIFGGIVFLLKMGGA